MTDNLTLADVLIDDGVYPPHDRPATREDIIAVLRELGGVEVDARKVDGAHVIPTFKAGRYLIIPIGESNGSKDTEQPSTMGDHPGGGLQHDLDF